MKDLVKIAWLAGVLLFAACSSTKTSTASSDQPVFDQYGNDTVQMANPQSLANILARVPGVHVEERPVGTIVTIRGNLASPLFILDNVPVGNSYDSAASLINVNDIASVEVLKDAAETAIYGIRGKNGVIIIHTK